MEGRKPIRVFLRLRPPADVEDPSADVLQYFVENATSLSVEKKQFNFSTVFDPEITQEVFYDDVAQPVVEAVLNGQDGLIMAYGTTNSGKTYSISGPFPPITDHDGILLRACDDIFNATQEEYLVSAFEIHLEQPTDLLGNGKIELREENNLPLGINEIPVRTSAAARATFEKAFQKRQIGSTHSNYTSSRSHAFYTLRNPSTEARLCVVDLAGSERLKNTQAWGMRQKEGIQINKALTVLRRCIQAMRDNTTRGNKTVHVPVRDSLVTFALGRYLLNWKNPPPTSFIVCINPAEKTDSLHALEIGALQYEVARATKVCPVTPVQKPVREEVEDDWNYQMPPHLLRRIKMACAEYWHSFYGDRERNHQCKYTKLMEHAYELDNEKQKVEDEMEDMKVNFEEERRKMAETRHSWATSHYFVQKEGLRENLDKLRQQCESEASRFEADQREREEARKKFAAENEEAQKWRENMERLEKKRVKTEEKMVKNTAEIKEQKRTLEKLRDDVAQYAQKLEEEQQTAMKLQRQNLLVEQDLEERNNQNADWVKQMAERKRVVEQWEKEQNAREQQKIECIKEKDTSEEKIKELALLMSEKEAQMKQTEERHQELLAACRSAEEEVKRLIHDRNEEEKVTLERNKERERLEKLVEQWREMDRTFQQESTKWDHARAEWSEERAKYEADQVEWTKMCESRKQQDEQWTNLLASKKVELAQRDKEVDEWETMCSRWAEKRLEWDREELQWKEQRAIFEDEKSQHVADRTTWEEEKVHQEEERSRWAMRGNSTLSSQDALDREMEAREEARILWDEEVRNRSALRAKFAEEEIQQARELEVARRKDELARQKEKERQENERRAWKEEKERWESMDKQFAERKTAWEHTQKEAEIRIAECKKECKSAQEEMENILAERSRLQRELEEEKSNSQQGEMEVIKKKAEKEQLENAIQQLRDDINRQRETESEWDKMRQEWEAEKKTQEEERHRWELERRNLDAQNVTLAQLLEEKKTTLEAREKEVTEWEVFRDLAMSKRKEFEDETKQWDAQRAQFAEEKRQHFTGQTRWGEEVVRQSIHAFSDDGEERVAAERLWEAEVAEREAVRERWAEEERQRVADVELERQKRKQSLDAQEEEVAAKREERIRWENAAKELAEERELVERAQLVMAQEKMAIEAQNATLEQRRQQIEFDAVEFKTKQDALEQDSVLLAERERKLQALELSQVGKLTEERKELAEEQKLLEDEKKRVQSLAAKHEASCKVVDEAEQDIKKRRSELVDWKTEESRKIDEHQSKLDAESRKLELDRAKLDQHQAKLDAECDKLEKERAKFKEERLSLEKRMEKNSDSRKTAKVTQLEEDLRETKKLVGELETVIRQLKEEKCSQEKENREKEINTTREYDAMKAELAEWEICKEKWEDEYDNWLNSINELKDDVAHEHAELEKTRDQHETEAAEWKKERDKWEKEKAEHENEERLATFERTAHEIMRTKVRSGEEEDKKKLDEDKIHARTELTVLEEQRGRLTEEHRQLKCRYERDAISFDHERGLWAKQRTEMVEQFQREAWMYRQELNNLQQEVAYKQRIREKLHTPDQRSEADLIGGTPKRLKLTPVVRRSPRVSADRNLWRSPASGSRKRRSPDDHPVFFTPNEGTPYVSRLRSPLKHKLDIISATNANTTTELFEETNETPHAAITPKKLFVETKETSLSIFNLQSNETSIPLPKPPSPQPSAKSPSKSVSLSARQSKASLKAPSPKANNHPARSPIIVGTAPASSSTSSPKANKTPPITTTPPPSPSPPASPTRLANSPLSSSNRNSPVKESPLIPCPATDSSPRNALVLEPHPTTPSSPIIHSGNSIRQVGPSGPSSNNRLSWVYEDLVEGTPTRRSLLRLSSETDATSTRITGVQMWENESSDQSTRFSFGESFSEEGGGGTIRHFGSAASLLSFDDVNMRPPILPRPGSVEMKARETTPRRIAQSPELIASRDATPRQKPVTVSGLRPSARRNAPSPEALARRNAPSAEAIRTTTPRQGIGTPEPKMPQSILASESPGERRSVQSTLCKLTPKAVGGPKPYSALFAMASSPLFSGVQNISNEKSSSSQFPPLFTPPVAKERKTKDASTAKRDLKHFMRQPRPSLSKQQEKKKKKEKQITAAPSTELSRNQKWLQRRLQSGFSSQKMIFLLVEICGIPKEELAELDKPALIIRFLHHNDPTKSHSHMIAEADVTFKLPKPTQHQPSQQQLHAAAPRRALTKRSRLQPEGFIDLLTPVTK